MANDFVFKDGYKPYQCKTQEELDRLTSLKQSLQISQNLPAGRAAELALQQLKPVFREERREAAAVAKQELIAGRMAFMQSMNLTVNMQSGFPEQTAENYETFLEESGYFNKLRYDEFSGHIYYGDALMEDRYEAEIISKFSTVTQCQLENRAKIKDAIMCCAYKNSFNQLRDYLDVLEQEYIKYASEHLEEEKKLQRCYTLFEKFLGVKKSRLYRTMLYKWLISAVKRVYEPGCQVDNVIILVGDQGCGKSSLCSFLGMDWYVTDVPVDDVKEAALKMSTKWIVNMDEMAGLSKKESAQVKSFISLREDTFRIPYAHYDKTVKRHVVFIGTTNEDTFLRDSTAVTERRYWVIKCGNVRREDTFLPDEEMKAYIRLLWGQAVFAYKKNPNQPLYIEDRKLYDEFAADQLQYKIENESPLFSLVDDVLSGEYYDFTSDYSLSAQYGNPTSDLPRKKQDLFPAGLFDQLFKRLHYTSWPGWMKQYASMREGWEIVRRSCPYGKHQTARCLKRVKKNDNENLFE